MRPSLALGIVILCSVAAAHTAAAANYVLYAQGRGWKDWSTSERVNVTGSSWTNVTVAYDGGASIRGPATTTLRTALEQRCATSTGNTCIVVCYSAGCLRFLKAIHDSSVTSFNIVRVSAIASAAGGTKGAEALTTGSLKTVAKLFGQQEAVDWDLTPAAARGTFGNVQNDMNKTTGTMYHYAGYKDTCKSFLFVKMCGNKYTSAGLTGAKSDGMVSFDSAGGASAQGAFNNLCATGGSGTQRITSLYAKRAPGVSGAACDGEYRDHAGMVGFGVAKTEAALAVTSTGDKNLTWSDNTSQTTCSDSSNCSQAFTDTSSDQATLLTSGGSKVTVAPNTDATSSPATADTGSATSCTGRCGLYQAGRACQCDAACVSGGDCCANYATTANCQNVKIW
ncbi:MAG TPA: hypothetical protein VIV40_18630 [Kofleriaceae bacterium]